MTDARTDPGVPTWQRVALRVAAGVRPVVEVTGTVLGDWLEVRVTDNRVGIPEHQREAVFETFYRAHPEGYGGTIHVVPAPRGSGSTFVFRLPQLATTSAAPVVPVQLDEIRTRS